MRFQLIHLTAVPIYEQLLLEEYLLKHSEDNYIIIANGTPPAIVMGISGKVEELVHLSKVPEHIPLIRRFSGGGTVIVDEETVFVTFICHKKEHSFMPYPEPILRWAASMLQQVIPSLELKDNDFTLGEHKCGGNALYIKKERWLIHTSLLWDYKAHHMQLLKHPPKTPLYRKNRDHEAFLCKLRDFFPCKTTWVQNLLSSFTDQGATSLEPLPILPPSHLFSTHIITKSLAQNN
ncbi:lipoyl protein ligase domain-containing protein [Rhabdochlamydiaceae symbiont of Dictyostelium giganteum]|uniref:lipoyl protein ligase domain-containing protein n=1 Tax=Rhabdochlamydiaceae symbiont of Dictyostelium giganteum TaxID=3342349 RepID=UPI00384DA99E